jgi:hypothetical protein
MAKKPEIVHMMKWGPTTECGKVFYRPNPNRILYPTLLSSTAGVTCKTCLRAMEKTMVERAKSE